MKKIALNGSEYFVGKIVCVGRNYVEHAKELGNDAPNYPILFLKPPSALIFNGENIEYPPFTKNMHHEVELVLLIGEDLKNATLEEAEKGIAGYAVGLDMTARDLQNEYRKEGNPWTVSKCFDTSAALSEFVSATDNCNILENEIELQINDIVRQRDKLSLMIFSPVQLVSFISSRMKLEAGDLIYTGTPKGVSAVQVGDKLSAKIGDLCSLTVGVV